MITWPDIVFPPINLYSVPFQTALQEEGGQPAAPAGETVVSGVTEESRNKVPQEAP